MQLFATDRSSLYQNDGAAPPVKASNRMLQSGAAAFYATRNFAFATDANLPEIFSRNGVEGSSYSMLPTALSLVGQTFGPVFGIAADATAYNPAVNDHDNYLGFSFLPAAVQALYEEAGHVQADLGDAAWALPANYTYGQRVSRRIDQPKLFLRTPFDDPQSFVQHVLNPGNDVDLAAGTGLATIDVEQIDPITGLPHPPAQGQPAQFDTAAFQSEEHWAYKRTRLVNVQTYKTAQVEAVRLEIMYHNMNLLQAEGGEYPTHNVGGNDPEHTPEAQYGIDVNVAPGVILARIRAALVQSNRNAVTVFTCSK